MRRRMMGKNDDVHYVKSLISTGTQYIDTGVPVTNNTIIRASFFIGSFNVDYENYFGTIQNRCGCIRVANGSALGFPYKNYAETTNQMACFPPLDCNVIIDTNKNTYELNGNRRVYNGGFENFDFGYYPMCIFAKRRNESVEDLDVPGSFKLYSFFMEESGEQKRSLYPALDTYGIPCLYDQISGQYFYNKGTGQFQYEEL